MVIATTKEEIQTEIYLNGPVMVGLLVYEDFANYEYGVYSYTYGDLIGGHAMKVVGWGTTEKGDTYWICQN